MDFGNVVLEHRPVVICQCKYDMCVMCSVTESAHLPFVEDCFTKTEPDGCLDCTDHAFYQRMKVYGPRVVIHQDSHMGTCNDCGRLYKVEINEIPVTPGAIPYNEVVPY